MNSEDKASTSVHHLCCKKHPRMLRSCTKKLKHYVILILPFVLFCSFDAFNIMLNREK